MIQLQGGTASRLHINQTCKTLGVKGNITPKINSLVNWKFIKREKFIGGNGFGKSDMKYSIIAPYDIAHNVYSVTDDNGNGNLDNEKDDN